MKNKQMWVIVLQMFHETTKIIKEDRTMNKENQKIYSMSIRVSEEELDKLKLAAKVESYASYSEFVRRTALIEASRVLREERKRKEASNIG